MKIHNIKHHTQFLKCITGLYQEIISERVQKVLGAWPWDSRGDTGGECKEGSVGSPPPLENCKVNVLMKETVPSMVTTLNGFPNSTRA